jgi:hypothetical protein
MASLNNAFSQKLRRPIDYRFKNGETGYISFFSTNTKFPLLAVKNSTIGNSITRISINPKGEIDSINFINPIDSVIDNEVKRVINLSSDHWKKCDSIKQDQVLYIQIAFSLNGFKPDLFIPKSKELMQLFPKPIIITPSDSFTVRLSMENNLKQSFIRDEELSQRLNNDLKTNSLEEALSPLNELIKREPFNRDLYKARIMINIRLNRPELVDQDDNKLYDFAEGYSIADLNKDNE